VRALLDAGGDVHGFGDLHELEVIGWATFFRAPGDAPWDVVSLLLERGAHHHIFSSITVGDLDLIQKLVEQNPEALDRRMSRFEQGLTPLHFAMSRNRYDILDLLIELGADLEAEDKSGQTALEIAMLRGDREAMSRLHAAGAKPPSSISPSSFKTSMAKLADSIMKCDPAISVPDIAATLDWYTSIGFKEIGRYEDDGNVTWGMVSFGKAILGLVPGSNLPHAGNAPLLHGKPGPHNVSLWFYTDQIDRLYQLLKSRQLESAQGVLAGVPRDLEGIEFVEDLYDPFYGGRQFSIRDPNGYTLIFLQPAEQ
jgi:catechol 2,3-dioxygenase-like lactoylglutathione lyase family enzyme